MSRSEFLSASPYAAPERESEMREQGVEREKGDSRTKRGAWYACDALYSTSACAFGESRVGLDRSYLGSRRWVASMGFVN